MEGNNNRLYIIIGAVVVVVALLFFFMGGSDTPATDATTGTAPVTQPAPADPANDAISVEPADPGTAPAD